MSSAARPRIGRSYTRARRHPWVLGRFGDWRIPLGPYTPPQLAVASIGSYLLIETFSWWAPVLGPLPVVAWGYAIWAARHSKIGGRSPFLALMDAASLAASPRAGRIGGRGVRPMRPVLMSGSFFIEDAPLEAAHAPALAPSVPADTPSDGGRPAAQSPPAAPMVRVVGGSKLPAPVATALTPLQQILAAAAAAQPNDEIGEPR